MQDSVEEVQVLLHKLFAKNVEIKTVRKTLRGGKKKLKRRISSTFSQKSRSSRSRKDIFKNIKRA